MNKTVLREEDREPEFSAGSVYGEEGVLQYKIVRTDDPFREDESPDVYSLAVINVRGDGGSESCFAYDVTRSFARAAELARLLCRMTVFPDNLPEVLADLL